MSKNALRLRHHEEPRQEQEYARVRILEGNDQGAVFIFTKFPVKIGRSPECDLRIDDQKTSRVHAEVHFNGKSFMVKDLGSANGILLNDQAVHLATLQTKDLLKIGNTVFQFLDFSEPTRALQALVPSVESAKEEKKKFQDHQKKVLALGKVESLKKLSTPSGGAEKFSFSGSKSKRPLLYGGLGVLLIASFLLPEEGKKKQSEKVAKDQVSVTRRDLSSEEGEQFLTPEAKRFYHLGIREFREKNYKRALAQFEIAKQIDPSARVIQLYIENSKQSLKEEMKQLLILAKRNFDQHRYRNAKDQFEKIIHLQEGESGKEEALEAKNYLVELEKIGGF